MLALNKPLLPSVDAMMPYLRRIDATRWYANAGPLVKEYESRLEKIFGCYAVATSSATSGMTATLLSIGFEGAAINAPSWTFVATCNALRAAIIPFVFVDVEPHSWQAFPGKGTVGTCPFGMPPAFESGVITDAAAAFDIYAGGRGKVGRVPVVISTHATKCFSTGEGGLVLTTDERLAQQVREMINHGITLDRKCPIPGINAKMSEYHAAVGLASLDWWVSTRIRWFETKCKYVEVFGALAHTTPLSSLSWVGPTFAVRVRGRSLDRIMEDLAAFGIMSRRVWGRGAHRYDAYKNSRRGDLGITEKLADEVLFLPYSIDMTDDQIHHIHSSVLRCLEKDDEDVNPNLWGV